MLRLMASQRALVRLGTTRVAVPRPPILRYLATIPPDLKNEKPEASSLSETKAQPSVAQKSRWLAVKKGVSKAVAATVHAVKNPRETWTMIKEVIDHYWIGSKLLWADMKMASQIVGNVVRGGEMTRRERNQLIRTTMDIFRLVPFAVFVIVPFMEFLLPFALKLFPNMLPSTFQDDLKKEEDIKRELKMRLAVAGFLQETLQEMAKKSAKSVSGDEATNAKELIDFIDKARLGEPLSNDSVIRMAQLFKDEFTLANIARPQLVTMCRYMSLPPYGADAFLRFQLRNKLRQLKEDDRRILWEGIESLTVQELREACRERGMRAHGLNAARYSHQLKEWLDLSIQKNIPISLLIMSRAFMLSTASTQPADVLKSSMSSLDPETINEVVLAAASPSEENSLEIQKRRLESLQFQREMIAEEFEETAEAKQASLEKKKKATAGKATPAAATTTSGPDSPALSVSPPSPSLESNAVVATAASPTVSQSASITTATPAVPAPPSSTASQPTPSTVATPKPEEVSRLVQGSAFFPGDILDDKQEPKSRSYQTGNLTKAAFSPDTESDESTHVTSSLDESAKSSEEVAGEASVLHSAEILEKIEKIESKGGELSLHEIEALADLARNSSMEREKALVAILQAHIDQITSTATSSVEAGKSGASSVKTSAITSEEPARVTTSSEHSPVAPQLIPQAESVVSVAAASAEAVSVVSATAGTAAVQGTSDAKRPLADKLHEDLLSQSEHAAAELAELIKADHSNAQAAKNLQRMRSSLDVMLNKLQVKIEKTEKELGDRLRLLDLDRDGEISAEELRKAITTIFKRPTSKEEADELIALLDTDKDGKVSVAELMKYVESRKNKREVAILEEQLGQQSSGKSS